MSELISPNFITDIKEIILSSKESAVRSVDFHRVVMYWKMGERIFNEEQEGKERTDYGIYLIKKLAKELTSAYGSGFSKRQLERSRQFYRLFPIASTLRTQFNWTQYKLILSISDESKREYYELEAVKNSWNGKELERQINAQLYERLLASSDKESVMAIARDERIPESSSEIVKDPMFLEFSIFRKKRSWNINLKSGFLNLKEVSSE